MLSIIFKIAMQKTFKKLPEKKQTHILDTAVRVFARKGYYQANVAEICKEAGISNGALYKYFKNKESLFLSCFDYGVDLMNREIFARYLTASGTVFEKIRDVLETTSRFAKKHSDVVALYLELGSVSNNRFADVLSDKVEKSARDFHVELIKDARERGEIDSDIDINIAAYIIDNNLMLLAFSIISDHYNQRFQTYFSSTSRELDDRKKIDVIMASIGQLLKP